MNIKINKLLKKYSNIKFVYNEDKETFISFLNKLSNKVEKNNSNKMKDFLQILEYSFLKYSSFDNVVLYNPIELINALSEKNFFGEKIDTDELEKIIEKMKCFEKYLEGELKEKEFLEKKYGIKIQFIKENLASLSAGIYGKGLTNFSEINLIKKVKKLINFYPINFIKNIKLNSIIIVNSFYKKDIYGKKIFLGGFETSSDDNIYLSKQNLVNSFDHELYHQAMTYYDDFEKWRKIRKRQKKKYLYKNINKHVYGFARNYGKENISEDQATMAEELILNFNSLQKRVQLDKKLNLKLKLVKKAFLTLSNGIMNENWWKKKFKKIK